VIKLANKRNLSLGAAHRMGAMALSFCLVFPLAVSSTQVPPRPESEQGQRDNKARKEIPHPCCYCRCRIADYHKNCHKLCKLPPSSKDEVRMFNKIEDGFCVEVCMLKKEGRKHLNHK